MSNNVLPKLYKIKRKALKKRALAERYNVSDSNDNVVERFYMILEHRNKSHGYKKQNYVDNFYYTTTSGELGVIKSKGHNSGKILGDLLVRRGIIDPNTHDAKIELNGDKDSYGIKGVIIKHNRVLEDLSHALSKEDINYLTVFFDKAENCTMVIDKNFKSAYEPKYKDPAVYQGDLCSSQSCMSCRGEGAQQFYGNILCCNVVRFERDGQQVGRCIMYNFNGKRHFIRIYGKPEHLPKMYKLLKKEMKPQDLFGRSYVIDELKDETTVPDDAQNMYLDGSYYGFAYWVDDEDKTHYVMCSRNEASKMQDADYRVRFHNMKSTSPDTVEQVLNPRNIKPEYEYTCDNCGCGIHEDDDDCVWCRDNVYCCCDCAHDAGWECCEKCGEWDWGDDGVSTEDAWYCCESCAERDRYYKCEKCGKWIYEDYLHDVEGYGNLCDDCVDELVKNGDIVQCDWCNDYIKTCDAHQVIKKDNRGLVWLDDYCYENHMSWYDEIKEGDDVDEE